MMEFHHFMLKGELVEPMEQTVDSYVEGLRYDIANIVQLQTYWILSDV